MIEYGQQISIAGFAGMDGAKRHPGDTETTLVLTLYDQDGQLQALPVARTRDMELFQEWLRRFDRYTVPRNMAENAVPPLAEREDGGGGCSTT